MSNYTIRLATRTALPLFLLIAVSASHLVISSPRVDAQEPAKPEAKGVKQKELLKEQLAVVREIAKQSTEAYKAGTGSFDEVREATRMVLEAELAQCDSDEDRLVALEKIVAEAKKFETHAAQLSSTGQAPRTALKAKADRLQAEIALEQAKVKAASQVSLELPDQAALSEKQVAIKRAVLKMAEAQKKVAVAQLTSTRAQVAEAQAAESLAEKQVKRAEELVKQQAVETRIVDEHRTQWDVAKARRTAAEGKVVECEAQVLLEETRVELAHLEVEHAELRLKQLKVRLEKKR